MLARQGQGLLLTGVVGVLGHSDALGADEVGDGQAGGPLAGRLAGAGGGTVRRHRRAGD